MSRKLLQFSGVFAAGLLCGLGLVLGGMTQPSKIIGFLDPFGNWDISLLYVMLGAIALHAPLQWFIRRWQAPLTEPAFSPLPAQTINLRLVLGSALFGIGWGLSGYCPGPSIVALASGTRAVFVFVAAALVGTALAQRRQSQF